MGGPTPDGKGPITFEAAPTPDLETGWVPTLAAQFWRCREGGRSGEEGVLSLALRWPGLPGAGPDPLACEAPGGLAIAVSSGMGLLASDAGRLGSAKLELSGPRRFERPSASAPLLKPGGDVPRRSFAHGRPRVLLAFLFFGTALQERTGWRCRRCCPLAVEAARAFTVARRAAAAGAAAPLRPPQLSAKNGRGRA